MNTKEMDAIYKGLTGYESVVDQEIHYVYLNVKANRYHELVLKPHKRNFLHLCGVNYYDPTTKRKFNAIKFYEGLKAKKLSPYGMRKKDGTTDQKLQVISQLKDLTSCSNLKIIDQKISYLNYEFPSAIRSRKKIFALALEIESGNGSFAYIPTSLLNLKNNSKGNSIKPGHPVHCIYSVDVNTKSVKVICKTAEFAEYEKKKPYPYPFPTPPQPAI